MRLNKIIMYKVSVEPVMFLYMFAFSVTQVVEQALFVDKACAVDLKIARNICDHLERAEYESLKVDVQSLVSEFYQYNNIAGNGATVLLALVLGSWSDLVGRKAPLLLGLAGKLYYSFMVVINSAEWAGIDWPLYTIIYSATLPSAITGADVAIFMGCFSYLSDITTPKDRTWRVAILEAVYLLTMPTGIALGAYLFSLLNRSFAALFAMNAGMLLAAIIYSFIFLDWKTARTDQKLEAVTVKQVEEEPKGLLMQSGDGIGENAPKVESEECHKKKLNPPSNQGCFRKLFDWHHVLDLWRTVIRYRTGNRRAVLLTVFLAMALYTFQRATLIGLPLLSRKLRLRDTIIAAIGAVCSSSARLTFGLAQIPEIFYLGAVLASCGPLIQPVLRSMTSKLVPSSERGTLKTFPASIFFLTFASQLSVLFLV
ncbi:hypothetical protein J437_LFUL014986, partial [Ladona fulva]